MAKLRDRIAAEIAVTDVRPENVPTEAIPKDGVIIGTITDEYLQKLWIARKRAVAAADKEQDETQAMFNRLAEKLGQNDPGALAEFMPKHKQNLATKRYARALSGYFWMSITEEFPETPEGVEIGIYENWMVVCREALASIKDAIEEKLKELGLISDDEESGPSGFEEKPDEDENPDEKEWRDGKDGTE